ncbi:hypothetical protein Vi05172_g7949 [Venturia inaequalis]|nr:hypothetical protein Vi05172_g7949 [Venturia inaequalis]
MGDAIPIIDYGGLRSAQLSSAWDWDWDWDWGHGSDIGLQRSDISDNGSLLQSANP